MIKINMSFERFVKCMSSSSRSSCLSAPYEIKIAYNPYLVQNDFNVLKTVLK